MNDSAGLNQDLGLKPLVSISCVTYNHEKYIRRCLEGFVMQKTTFPFEVLVHDDASTDGTQAIIREFEKNYPHIIKPIYQKENQYSKGRKPGRINMNRARGKYYALCEGDDCWIHPEKLQKQVDFLENNPDYMLTSGGYISDMDGIKEERILSGLVGEDRETEEGFTFTLEDFEKAWFTKTLTLLCRNDKELFKQLSKYRMSRDVHLNYHLLKKGKGYYFKEAFGVYNRHSEGVHNGLSKSRRQITLYNLYKELYQHNGDDVSRGKFRRYALILLNRSLYEEKKPPVRKCLRLFKEGIVTTRRPAEVINLLVCFSPGGIKRYP